jgi:hypothetical protein
MTYTFKEQIKQSKKSLTCQIIILFILLMINNSATIVECYYNSLNDKDLELRIRLSLEMTDLIRKIIVETTDFESFYEKAFVAFEQLKPHIVDHIPTKNLIKEALHSVSLNINRTPITLKAEEYYEYMISMQKQSWLWTWLAVGVLLILVTYAAQDGDHFQ